MRVEEIFDPLYVDLIMYRDGHSNKSNLYVMLKALPLNYFDTKCSGNDPSLSTSQYLASKSSQWDLGVPKYVQSRT